MRSMSRGLLESVSCHVYLRCENEEYIRFSSGSWPFAAQARLETTTFGFGIGETRFFSARQMDMDGHMRPYGLMEPKKKQIKKIKPSKNEPLSYGSFWNLATSRTDIVVPM